MPTRPKVGDPSDVSNDASKFFHIPHTPANSMYSSKEQMLGQQSERSRAEVISQACHSATSIHETNGLTTTAQKPEIMDVK